MSSQAQFRPTPIAKLEQLSTVEVRHDVLRTRDIRPGHTSALPGVSGSIEGHTQRFEDVHARPRQLAPHLQRVQNTLAADGQPRSSSARVTTTSTGEDGIKLEPQDRIDFPSFKEAKGHQLKNRLTPIRNRGSI